MCMPKQAGKQALFQLPDNETQASALYLTASWVTEHLLVHAIKTNQQSLILYF